MFSLMPSVKRLLTYSKPGCSYTPVYPDTCLLLATLDETFNTDIHEHDNSTGCCLKKFEQTVDDFHAEIKKLKAQL